MNKVSLLVSSTEQVQGFSPAVKYKIIVIDETIREGMQYRGIVFSLEQREIILKFQEKIGVDICQAGYAPSHITEQENISCLHQITKKQDYNIRVAGMGRASLHDVESLIKTGIADFHLHTHISKETKGKNIEDICHKIREAVEAIKTRVAGAKILIALLDIGSLLPELFLPELILDNSLYLNNMGIDILSLADTSGVMSPDNFYNSIKKAVLKLGILKQISVHCHNDLGMASANTFMGVKAGATVVELSTMGIGERNGIGDLFTVGKMLKDQGYNIRLKTDEIKLFRAYYQYVSDICKTQTGETLLNYNTPFFGNGIRTHVAGTHAGSGFGLFNKLDDDTNAECCLEEYYLNVLCGRHLVKRYLESMAISYNSEQLHNITEEIKSQSAGFKRRLEKNEIITIVQNYHCSKFRMKK